MVDEEDKEYIATARKYGLRLFKMRLEAFIYFDKGYSPMEVVYLLRHWDSEPTPDKMKRTIRKYYSDWKKAQDVDRSTKKP